MSDDNTKMETSELTLWVENEIIPKIVEILGKDVTNMRCEIKFSNNGFNVSSVYFVKIIFPSEKNKMDEIFEYVIKTPPAENVVSEIGGIDYLFHNEIIFYEKFAQKFEGFPKSTLIISGPKTRPVIVLENEEQFGFKPVKNENVDLKRILSAIREIGRFHAMAYLMRENNLEQFNELIGDIQPHKYGSNAHPVLVDFINSLAMRPVNYLKSINYDPVFCEKLRIIVENTHKTILQDCGIPRNELATLCHGDFNMNNVLVREGGNKNDQKFEAKLIDFAQIHYGSPAIDISFFYYMSCNEEMRKEFPRIFKTYHEVLFAYLEEHGISNIQRFSYEAFLKDYKRHAAYGCFIAIGFIQFIHTRDHWIDLINETSDSFLQVAPLLKAGGDELSKKLADMIIELRDHGCLDHLI